MSDLQKITEQQMDAVGVCSAPDMLTGSASENKAVFDKMVRQLIAPAYNAAVDAIDAINQAESGIQAAEEARAEAEEGRTTAEEARAAAESGRLLNEQARVSAEQARGDAETARGQAEEGRQDAETERVSAEEERLEAEQARLTAEDQREDAEAARAAADSARNVWEDYDPSHDYVPGNKVAHNGSSYLNISACKGIAPPSQNHWLLIAERGQNGTGAGDFLADGSVPMTGALQMGGNRVTGLGTPQAGTDAVPKSYADALAPLLVTVSGGDSGAYAADHTAYEICQAAQAGRDVFARMARSSGTGWDCFMLEYTDQTDGNYAAQFWGRRIDGEPRRIFLGGTTSQNTAVTVTKDKLVAQKIPVLDQDPAEAENGQIWVVSAT